MPQFGKCAICGKQATEQFNPFCSKRCAQVDLGRWLGEGYRIETPERPGDFNPENDEEMG
ncbi:MAG: DNA gyrase inhibitor YacG [Alphaproteobacteria bacterium]|nr:DNA gyrase inhibitor YacG [Alphaproteobacteria bacterium]